MELCLIFLGDSVLNFKVRIPGATTHARFMAKGVYSFKIFIFRDQFSLTPGELKSIRNVCIFLADVYMKNWYGCEKAIQAPNRDLILMKSIVGYHDQQTSSALIAKFRRHLWYLSEELVAFAFFDTEVSLEMKREMIAALNVQGCWQNHKRFEPSVEEFGLFVERNLCDFVTPRSQQLFDRLEMETDFLLFDPSVWNEREDYKAAVQKCQDVQVVNDSAERAVKLITDYNRSLTHDEDDRQYLLQVVEFYRQKYPDYKKSTVSN